MVLKFLTAGVITALLAGGAVYLGLDDDMIASLQDRGIVAETTEGDTPQIPAVSGIEILDAPISHETADGNTDGEVEMAESEDPLMPYEGKAFEPMSGASTDETPVATTETRKVTVTETIEVDTSPIAINAEANIKKLLSEASRLPIADMRNDAYLSVVDYAVANSRYDEATDIIAKITMPELRDTARQRIGIGYVQSGQMSEAFAVLDDLDIEALSDPIRLEIIRAAGRSE